jgi:hypothetical protein
VLVVVAAVVARRSVRVARNKYSLVKKGLNSGHQEFNKRFKKNGKPEQVAA